MKRKPPTTDAPEQSVAPPAGMPVEWLDLPDEQLGIHLLAMWFDQLCMTKGIAVSDLDEATAEAMRRRALQDMDARVDLVPLEKAIRLVAQGEPGPAGKLFREFMLYGADQLRVLDEAVTGRRRQTSNAKKDRGDLVTRLVTSYIRVTPGASEREVREHIEAQRMLTANTDKDEDGITDVDDEGVSYWWHGKFERMQWSALKDRISRARKKISHSR